MPLGQVCLSDNSLNRLRLFRLDGRAVMRQQTDTKLISNQPLDGHMMKDLASSLQVSG